MKTSLDALILSPHPDDAEIFCGGVIATLVDRGHRVGIADCTQGELGSRGDIKLRKKEAEAASSVLGISVRENLKLPDGFLTAEVGSQQGIEQIKSVVSVIRKHSPRVLFVPYWQGRPPDHEACSALGTKAAFYAALPKFETTSKEAPHTVSQVIYYQFRYEFIKPSFVTDITQAQDRKMKAIKAYASQIDPEGKNSNDTKTLVSSRFTLSSIEARDRYFGAMIGVAYAEAFLLRTALPIEDPVRYFTERPSTGALIFPHRD